MPPDQEMTTMGDKKNKKKTKKVEETAVAEIHWVRSTLILVFVVALTFGVWYLVSERG
jgi:predicted secreted protein